MKGLDGGNVALGDVLGKATLVVFFFPTCPYCNAELPEIQRLYDAYKADGLTMVWINVLPEQEERIEEWRSRHGFTVPILLGGQSTLTDYQVRMTPAHYLLDPQGRVLTKHAGYKKGDEQTLEREIRTALAK